MRKSEFLRINCLQPEPAFFEKTGVHEEASMILAVGFGALVAIAIVALIWSLLMTISGSW